MIDLMLKRGQATHRRPNAWRDRDQGCVRELLTDGV
jgi:hypothetical protein